MNYKNKMDVLDMIITTLKEHEKVLDELTHRIESCLPEDPSAGSKLRLQSPDTNQQRAELESWR
ncbi:MAG TPA: hypothetical protein VM050_05515 [Patescibacteria group bacterium]|nr:hypothetical protein [Patescibacteria group bacterium]